MYRAAVGNSVDRIELKEVLQFVFLFWVKNSYLFPIFWPLSFLFSYFLSVICHLTPWGNENKENFFFFFKYITFIYIEVQNITLLTDLFYISHT